MASTYFGLAHSSSTFSEKFSEPRRLGLLARHCVSSTSSVMLRRADGSLRQFSGSRRLSPIYSSSPPRASAGDGGPPDFEPLFLTAHAPPLKMLDEIDRANVRKRLLSLKSSGISGLLVEVSWGVVEVQPLVYEWKHYEMLLDMAKELGFKVRVELAFHRDPHQRFDLPQWLITEMNSEERSTTYITIGADTSLPIRGRTPLQLYKWFMLSFFETFEDQLLEGGVIQDVVVGLEPEDDNYTLSEPEKTRYYEQWWRGVLIIHGDMVLEAARRALPNVTIIGKVACSLTPQVDMFSPYVSLFARYGVKLCCPPEDFRNWIVEVKNFHGSQIAGVEICVDQVDESVSVKLAQLRNLHKFYFKSEDDMKISFNIKVKMGDVDVATYKKFVGDFHDGILG